MGGWVSVIPSGKVAVVGGDDGVGLSCRAIFRNSGFTSCLTPTSQLLAFNLWLAHSMILAPSI
jgi:hypothetical protein